MPGITKLLNRKKLGIGESANAGKPAPAPAQATDPKPLAAAEPEVVLAAPTPSPTPVPTPSPAAPEPFAPAAAAPPPPSEVGVSPSGEHSLQIEIQGAAPALVIEQEASARIDTRPPPPEPAPAPALAPVGAPLQVAPPKEPRTMMFDLGGGPPGLKAAPAGPTAKITPARLHSRATAAAPKAWPMPQIYASSDPLARGLAYLFEQGASRALYLGGELPAGIDPDDFEDDEELEQFVPLFRATATVKARPEDTRLWSGLTWDPQLLPEAWEGFLRSGHLDLSPPGQRTHGQSPRNVLRAAMGVGGQEYALMLRVGTLAACRGVLVAFSSSPLEGVRAQAQALVGELPQADEPAADLGQAEEDAA